MSQRAVSMRIIVIVLDSYAFSNESAYDMLVPLGKKKLVKPYLNVSAGKKKKERNRIRKKKEASERKDRF